ncbi:MAG: hypothetical protein ACRELA_04240 [Candidatus Rokuibacteriota bacterium]
MARDADGFDPAIALPPDLKIAHIRPAIEYIEEQTSEFSDVYYEQANVFSALVGIFGIRALDTYSPYKKHKHPDVAQQRFPDLSLRGKLKPPPLQAVESKGSRRPWAIQSHYDHPGWYVVWRYLVDPTKKVKPGRVVVVWRVDVVFLRKEDWKYEGSKAGEAGGGRTHTFGVKNPHEKLQSAAAYQHPNIVVRAGGPTLTNGKKM